ncbi:DnaJ (Hsp40), sub C, member 2 [Desmophyllum pertusum]|uniref:DnaJ (Hsp40), sub C, member 2 n=1 Tax=Desmophyllum pertusum TaxID=174260 RepID=A0A9W9Z7J5_9CNID|nr:DnaJ (Hsp40), sub C, member 2 [Desmophyllum pertusum]
MDTMEQMRERMRQEAIAETKQTTKSKDDDEVTSDDWTEDQTQLLIKAVNLFPAGTASRWKVIADYVNMHAKTGTLRDSKHVIKKVKNLQKLGNVKSRISHSRNLVEAGHQRFALGILGWFE